MKQANKKAKIVSDRYLGPSPFNAFQILLEYKYWQKQSPGDYLWKGVLKNFVKFTGKQLYQISFLTEWQGSVLQLYKKETLAQVFLCEFCKKKQKKNKNTFSIEHLRWKLLYWLEMGIRQISFNKLLWVVTSKASVNLTLSWRRWLLYRNQCIDLQDKSMDWFLYDTDLRHVMSFVILEI